MLGEYFLKSTPVIPVENKQFIISTRGIHHVYLNTYSLKEWFEKTRIPTGLFLSRFDKFILRSYVSTLMNY